MKTTRTTLENIFIESDGESWSQTELYDAITEYCQGLDNKYNNRVRADQMFGSIVGEAFDHFADIVVDEQVDWRGALILKKIMQFVNLDPSLTTTFAMDCCMEENSLEFE